jgi:hypothetical protein
MAGTTLTNVRSPLALTGVREKFNAARNFMNSSPQRRLGLNSACQKPRLVSGATEKTGARRICGGSRKTRVSRRPRASGDLPAVDTVSAISVSRRPPRPRGRRSRGMGARNQVRGGGQGTKTRQYEYFVLYAWIFPGQQCACARTTEKAGSSESTANPPRSCFLRRSVFQSNKARAALLSPCLADLQERLAGYRMKVVKSRTGQDGRAILRTEP